MQLLIIQSKIYELLGLRVMLDFDLAERYETETKYLKRVVKHNLRRFPSDFMFELSKQEFETLRCNFSTSNKRGGIRYMPFAFTEQGVAMLSAVLNSQKAIDVNISFMRAFVSIRQLSLSNTDLRNTFEKLAKQTNTKSKSIEIDFQYLDELMEKNEKPTKRNRVGNKHYD